MKKIFLLIFCSLLHFVQGQNCNTNLTFINQASIDNFVTNNPGCVRISGILEISGDDITDIDGLSVINRVGSLRIHNNPLLRTLTGLSSLTNVDYDIDIDNNPSLTSLDGLNALSTLGSSLRIVYNQGLSSLSALNKLTNVYDFLSVGGNRALVSLAGLENITFVGGALSLDLNFHLSNLNGLNGLTRIGGYLHIGNGPKLSSLTGLMKLVRIGGYIYIHDLNNLSTLSGLDNIDPESIENVRVINSTGLSFCGVKSICIFLSVNGAYKSSIVGNAVGCSSRMEVVTSNTCLVILPVNLVVFGGMNTAEGNYVTWQTTSETNNSGFSIERSPDGNKFEEIGYQDGSGTTSQIKMYSFLDKFPYFLTYYRLKQIDLDKTSSYSRIIAVKKDFLKNEMIKVYPNPSVNELFIESSNTNQQYRLYNSNGIVVKEALSIPLRSLDTSRLSNGFYVLQVGKETFNVVINH